VCGLAASFLCGLLVALVFSQSRLIQRAVFPYAIFLQTVPIVAIAPLVILWFGNGMFSVSLIAFIISVFPVMTNATAGLTAVDPHLLDLFELYGASRWQTLLKLRLPGAVPHLVVGLKIACGLSVIGSIVGETFAGPGMGRVGLGYLIQLTSGQTKTDYAFAALACSALLGVALFSAVSLVGNWIVTSRGGRPV
jgi:NitT/TauT family transport system permease protein